MLSGWGFRANRHLNLPICLACSSVIPPRSIQTHLNGSHKGSGISVSQGDMECLISQFGISPEWPTRPDDIPLAFKGLRTKIGTLCPYPGCHGTWGDASAVKAHYMKDHVSEEGQQDAPRTRDLTERVYMQCFNTGGKCNQWFRV